MILMKTVNIECISKKMLLHKHFELIIKLFGKNPVHFGGWEGGVGAGWREGGRQFRTF